MKKYHKDYAQAIASDNEYMIEIAKRPWKLELPFSSYVGTYRSDLFVFLFSYLKTPLVCIIYSIF